MQVSPSGMAAASQAVPGEFDSRHLLQVSIIRTIYKSRVNGSDYLSISKKTGVNSRLSMFFFLKVLLLFHLNRYRHKFSFLCEIAVRIL